MSLVTIPIPAKTYNVGSVQIPPTAVPAGSSSMTIVLDVTQWTNPASVLSVAMEMSTDGGVTWVGGGAFTTHPNANGQFPGKSGAPLSTIMSFWSWPSSVTHLRGTVTITGTPIQTSGTITVN